jgi:TorA maturation chaperone TorD
MNPDVDVETANSKASQARLRSTIYGFLARLFRREPGMQLVEYLRTPEGYRSLREAGMDLGREELFESPAEQLAESLAGDYRALFTSPGDRIALNESIHGGEDGCFMGESTIRVGEFIKSLGLTIEENWTDFPDHISVEFELMERLAEAEASLRDKNDSGMADQCSSRQQAFLSDHIGKWVPQLCDSIEARARTPFYRQLARLTKTFICEEKRLFG